jgi:hypothetical protein
MKSLFCSALFLLTFSLNAQAPTAVPVKDEPHHKLVLENSYVRVYRVSINAGDATLLHQHDLPYVFVSLGPADFTNAVAGKPEVEAKLADGQLGYSRGGFAHIARTDHGLPFNNVTVELLHPQGDPHNGCAKVVASDPAGDCPAVAAGAFVPQAQFDTSEIQAQIITMGPKSKDTELATKHALLYVGLGKSEIKIQAKGKPAKKLSEGEVYWADDDSEVTFDNSGGEPARMLAVIFKSGR